MPLSRASHISQLCRYVLLQSFNITEGSDVIFYSINGVLYLAFSQLNPDVVIFRWNGAQFDYAQV